MDIDKVSADILSADYSSLASSTDNYPSSFGVDLAAGGL
jgi:hypothetical protein